MKLTTHHLNYLMYISNKGRYTQYTREIKKTQFYKKDSQNIYTVLNQNFISIFFLKFK